MPAPFSAGDTVAFISADPRGVRVQQTRVLSVQAEGNGWSVETEAGVERVDERGEGAQLVPIDREMATLFEERGATSFVVGSTHDEDSHERHRREQDARERERAQERDRHRDAGR